MYVSRAPCLFLKVKENCRRLEDGKVAIVWIDEGRNPAVGIDLRATRTEDTVVEFQQQCLTMTMTAAFADLQEPCSASNVMGSKIPRQLPCSQTADCCTVSPLTIFLLLILSQ